VTATVAWVAPCDLRPHASQLGLDGGGHFHNAPWISLGLAALAPHVNLHVVTYDRRLGRDHRITEGGITYHLLSTPWPKVPRAAVAYLLDVPRFLAVLDGIQPDIVHGHGTENLFSLVAVKSGRPHVVSMQGYMRALLRTRRAVSRSKVHFAIVAAIERWTIRRASTFTVEAPFLGDIVRGQNPTAEVHLVPNMVRPEFFGVSRAGGPRTNVYFVGSLVPAKGIEETIRAFHRVECAGAELHIVGTGHRSYVTGVLEHLVQAGPARQRIRFHGHWGPERIADAYRNAAAVVLPSHCDTSPNVVAEALVAGVPVVASRVGGMPFMLDDGKAGALVSLGDLGELSDAIDWCLGSPDSAARVAAHGLVMARDRYGRERYLKTLLALYDHVAPARSCRD
jgi:glycosyltransferase involved in cell wall biosynthesis